MQVIVGDGNHQLFAYVNVQVRKQNYLVHNIINENEFLCMMVKSLFCIIVMILEKKCVLRLFSITKSRLIMLNTCRVWNIVLKYDKYIFKKRYHILDSSQAN